MTPTRPVRPRDQPRTCGEYRVCRCGPGWMGGSAPHMRGIQAPVGALRVSDGISPAHAGNTIRRKRLGARRTDQPRTCGEYPTERLGGAFADGSAPHMRGIPPHSKRQRPGRRISPAHAGNTQGELGRPCTRGDQPRTCGEYLTGWAAVSGAVGSAPHMRGIRGPPA